MTFGVASLAIPREWRCRHLLAFLAAVLLVLAVPRDVAFAADDDHYQLAVGDVLEFDFMDDEELPRQLTIADDGTVQAPLLGSVKVVGMPVPQAYAELRRLYIERQLFVDPRIALSVVSFRPVFVLGDVKTPGSFNYRPGLTVEKAIGLAGGLSTLVGNVQDQILSRSKLRGDLDQSSSAITGSAVSVARLTAQLDGRDKVSLDEIPKPARAYLKDDLLKTLMVSADLLLSSEIEALKTQTTLLNENIAEATNGLETLEKLSENQKSAIQFSQEDYARADALLKKGLKTATEVSNLQRQATLDEGRLLTIYSQVSEARRNLGSLKREVAKVTETARKTTLTDLQTEQARLEQLLAERRATEEQLFLVTNWTSEEALKNRVALVEYKVRRKTMDKGVEEIPVETVTGLRPDDVLMVTVQRPKPEGQAVAQ